MIQNTCADENKDSSSELKSDLKSIQEIEKVRRMCMRYIFSFILMVTFLFISRIAAIVFLIVGSILIGKLFRMTGVTKSVSILGAVANVFSLGIYGLVKACIIRYTYNKKLIEINANIKKIIDQ